MGNQPLPVFFFTGDSAIGYFLYQLTQVLFYDVCFYSNVIAIFWTIV